MMKLAYMLPGKGFGLIGLLASDGLNNFTKIFVIFS